MVTAKYKKRVIVTVCSLAIASMSGFVAAQSTTQGATTANPPANSRVLGNEAKDAAGQVREAAKVVQQMERDAGMKKVLQQAQGIFIAPDYGRVALGVGARGGEGVLVLKRNGSWTNPAFYNFGGVSAGAQAGIEAGSIALVLNSQKAVKSFRQDNNWSLNAEAGLTVINWSGKAQGSVGKGDVIVWSDTEGLFGDLAVSVTDINFDEDETAAFYGKQVAVNDIFSGKVKPPAAVASLKNALQSKTTATGSSGTMSKGQTGSSGATGNAGSSSSGNANNPDVIVAPPVLVAPADKQGAGNMNKDSSGGSSAGSSSGGMSGGSSSGGSSSGGSSK